VAETWWDKNSQVLRVFQTSAPQSSSSLPMAKWPKNNLQMSIRDIFYVQKGIF
jgi:hypothetical protein